ncbi:hypothetical protein R6Q57_021462, partial [Mikania cordata]
KLFNIQTDGPKSYLLKKTKKILTNFKIMLVNEYVKKKGELPYGKYKFLDATHWDNFCKEKTSEEFVICILDYFYYTYCYYFYICLFTSFNNYFLIYNKAKSNKARMSEHMNKNFADVGRTVFIGLNEKFKTIWAQHELDFEHIKNIQNDRTKLWILSKANKKKETKSYELASYTKDKINELAYVEKEMIEDGTYFKGIDDPLNRVLGPEHGGRSSTVSNVTGSTKVKGGIFKVSKHRNPSVASVYGNLGTAPIQRVEKSTVLHSSSDT